MDDNDSNKRPTVSTSPIYSRELRTVRAVQPGDRGVMGRPDQPKYETSDRGSAFNKDRGLSIDSKPSLDKGSAGDNKVCGSEACCTGACVETPLADTKDKGKG